VGTPREYYETDFPRTFIYQKELILRWVGGETRFAERVHHDLEANATFVSCLLPEDVPLVEASLAALDAVPLSLEAAKTVGVKAGFVNEPDADNVGSSDASVFTQRIFLYAHDSVGDADRRAIRIAGEVKGLRPIFRDAGYARRRSELEKPLAFICHDSRDKDSIARPIALGLSKCLCPVWYDEYSLKVGDRLRESVEKGLKECRRCVLVLSPSFLLNPGWTRAEFNSVFTRELIEGRDVLLPVWHQVTRKDVYEYSPSLADRFAVDWSAGEEEVIRRLHAAIRSTD